MHRRCRSHLFRAFQLDRAFFSFIFLSSASVAIQQDNRYKLVSADSIDKLRIIWEVSKAILD